MRLLEYQKITLVITMVEIKLKVVAPTILLVIPLMAVTRPKEVLSSQIIPLVIITPTNLIKV
jgi:hypothetical protein